LLVRSEEGMSRHLIGGMKKSTNRRSFDLFEFEFTERIDSSDCQVWTRCWRGTQLFEELALVEWNDIDDNRRAA
jgi:hypothetical protein